MMGTFSDPWLKLDQDHGMFSQALDVDVSRSSPNPCKLKSAGKEWAALVERT